MSDKKHILAVYVVDRAVPSVTREDAEKLTHLNVAFGLVKDDKIDVSHLQNTEYIKKIKEFNKDLKVILSVGGWGAGGFSEAASTAEGRGLFAASACEIVKEGIFDGIDIDWEYPCYSEAAIKSSPDDRVNFTLFLKELRERLDRQGEEDGRRYLLTIAAGADQYFIDGTEMEKVQEYLDFIQLMTYDMRGGFQTLTGHHTNLFTPSGDLFRISADRSAKAFIKAGVPKNKIVLGAAFYSRMWKNVPDINNGLHQMTAGAGGYGPSYAELEAKYINKNGYTRYWDDEAKAPYLFDGTNFITYDDPESLAHKCWYVKENGLAGIMSWEFSSDSKSALLSAMYDNLLK